MFKKCITHLLSTCIRYRGYYYDEDIDLYYLQSRYYDPNTGRFINADDTDILQATQGDLLGGNLYAYCHNNPVMYSDPSGYWAEKYTGFLITTVGFNVNYNNSFLLPFFCTSFAGDIAKKYGSYKWYTGWKFRDMTIDRMARELFVHAILYAIGAGLITSAKINASIASLVGIEFAKALMTLAAYVHYNFGTYLVSHARVISINNNESWKRMLVYNTIWAMTPWWIK